jgi:hypothetical protein
MGRPLGRPRRRWKHKIRTDLKEMGRKERRERMWLRIGTSGGMM